MGRALAAATVPSEFARKKLAALLAVSFWLVPSLVRQFLYFYPT